MFYNSKDKLQESVDWLVDNILRTQLSFYIPKYESLKVTIRVLEDEVTGGYLVWFYTGLEVKETFTVLSNIDFDLETYVHEALCRLLEIYP